MESSQREKNCENRQKSNSNTDARYSTNEVCRNEKPVNFNSRIFLMFFYILLSCVAYTMVSVLMKKLSYIHPGQLACVRNFGVLAGSFPIGIYSTRNILGEKGSRLLLFLRGVLGGAVYYLSAVSVAYLPIVEDTIILNTLPVVTAVMARVALRETCGFIQSVILITAVCGVLLAVNLPGLLSVRADTKVDYTYILGIAAAVASVLMGATAYIIVRKLKDVHFSSVMISFGVLGMTINATITLATSSTFVQPNCGWDIMLYILIPVFGFLGNIMSTITFQAMDAGIVTTLRTIQIPLSIVFQIIFFYKIPNVFNICGGLLVVVSVSVLGIRKYGLALPEHSNTRKRLKYLLY